MHGKQGKKDLTVAALHDRTQSVECHCLLPCCQSSLAPPAVGVNNIDVKHGSGELTVPAAAALAVLAGGEGEASLLYTLLHRKSSTAVMLANGSINTTLLE